MNNFSERRKFDRFEFQKPVRVFVVNFSKSGHVYEVSQNSIEAWANNIGEGGLRLESVQPFDPNLSLKFNFEFAEDMPVEIYGKVAWSHDHHCGIRFLIMHQNMRPGIRAMRNKT